MIIRNKHNKKQQNIATGKWVLWGVLGIALLVLNYWYLNKYLSFNSAYVTDFAAPEDNLAEYRNPATAGIFYSSSGKNRDKNNIVGYFNFNKEYKPKIFIVPFMENLVSTPTLGKVYTLLQKTAPQIKNIIILGGEENDEDDVIYLPHQNKLSDKYVDLNVNTKIVNDLKTENSFYALKNLTQQSHRIYEQLPFIYKSMPRVNVIPLSYGKISPQKISESIKKYINRPDTIMMVPANLSCHETDTINEEQENKDKCGMIGVNTALLLSQENNYRLQVFDLASRGEQTFDYNRWRSYPDSNDLRPLKKIEQDVKNITSFVNLYGNDLWLIAQTALDKAMSGRREFSPSRRSFPEDIFNRGAAYVYILKNGKQIGVSGDILPNKSVADSVADNTYYAAKNLTEKITKNDLNNISLKIYLLSNCEAIKYKNEYDLLQKLQKGIDGLIIQDGSRQGVFMPLMWQKADDEKDFLKKLKVKAGLNPNYWNSRIKVYRFRTVEVTHEN